MFRNKRDVDRHVAELYAKIPADLDRCLKGYSVAKLYFSVGDHRSALQFLDKYDKVRKNSPSAFKLRGQVLEALAGFEESSSSAQDSPSSAASASAATVQQLKSEALDAYRRAYDLDLTQKDLVLKVVELMLDLPITDPERTRYWVEQGFKFYPKDKAVQRLKVKMEDFGVGGGAASKLLEESAASQGGGSGGGPGVEDDNSILWSTTAVSSSSFVVGDNRFNLSCSTPNRNGFGSYGNSAVKERRFVPRPSPERLQVRLACSRCKKTWP